MLTEIYQNKNKKFKAIFIQNFFRFGGSYFYNQFIKNKSVIGFYEPFHEDLSNIKKIEDGRKNFQKRKKLFNHPNEEFYFQNYPLNKKWFKEFHNINLKSNFFLVKKKEITIFQNYLKNLIDFGYSNMKLPVFKLNRVYLNPEVLEINEIYKIFLFRDPVASFFSNIRLNLLKPYYDRISQLASEGVEPFKSLWNLVLLNEVNHITLKEKKINFVSQKDLEVHYSIFFYIWLYGLYKNFEFNYTFINYSKLEDTIYKNKISEEIFLQCNIQIDFSNFDQNKDPSYSLKIPINQKINNLIKNFMDANRLNRILSNNFDINHFNLS